MGFLSFIPSLLGGLMSIFGGGKDKQASSWQTLAPLIGGGALSMLMSGLGGGDNSWLTGRTIYPQAVPTYLPQQVSLQNILMGSLLKGMGMDPSLLFGGQDPFQVIRGMQQPFYPSYAIFGAGGAAAPGKRYKAQAA